ncbi:Agamous-like MADS-box protein AGL80 [Apostasia shenzhenica]|uniref:Agamous-like MADS-box protein AGL80 n=1 Tax=Apostasia shenzhenica TaxID=1088818 RepID=A0A2I0AI14_9ASPA|nr:Agamous-like MADS-box protein AGL80 [Apostasia shenzhenica]
MARKKVTLAWICNDATRRATLKKRRRGLMKKVKELSILCDVRACAIVYSPHETQPEVWPSVAEAARILARFRSMPEIEQSKKMLDQESFLRQRVARLHDQLNRLQRENHELEAAAVLRECLAGSSLLDLRIEELASLAWMLEHKAKVVQERIDQHLILAAAAPELEMPPMEGAGAEVDAGPLQPPGPPPPPPPPPPLLSLIGDGKFIPCHEGEFRWIPGGSGGHEAYSGAAAGPAPVGERDYFGGGGGGGEVAELGLLDHHDKQQSGWENCFFHLY